MEVGYENEHGHDFSERDPVMGRVVWCSRCSLMLDRYKDLVDEGEASPCTGEHPEPPEPDLDAVSARETYERDFQQHRDLHR